MFGDQIAAAAVAVLLVLGEGGAMRVVQRQMDVAVVGDLGQPGDDGAEGAGVDDRAQPAVPWWSLAVGGEDCGVAVEAEADHRGSVRRCSQSSAKALAAASVGKVPR